MQFRRYPGSEQLIEPDRWPSRSDVRPAVFFGEPSRGSVSGSTSRQPTARSSPPVRATRPGRVPRRALSRSRRALPTRRSLTWANGRPRTT